MTSPTDPDDFDPDDLPTLASYARLDGDPDPEPDRSGDPDDSGKPVTRDPYYVGRDLDGDSGLRARPPVRRDPAPFVDRELPDLDALDGVLDSADSGDSRREDYVRPQSGDRVVRPWRKLLVAGVVFLFVEILLGTLGAPIGRSTPVALLMAALVFLGLTLVPDRPRAAPTRRSPDRRSVLPALTDEQIAEIIANRQKESGTND